MTWLSRIIDRRRRRTAALRIIQEAEDKMSAAISPILFGALAECERRDAELNDMAANGTPEERQWATAMLDAPLIVTPEEAERRRNEPAPTARIGRYRAECAAYDAAHSERRVKMDD